MCIKKGRAKTNSTKQNRNGRRHKSNRRKQTMWPLYQKTRP